MTAAAPARTRDGQPSSLGRKLAAVAGAGGALVAGTEAYAVTYTPTAGVVAAHGIPGFLFVDASTVTLGNLRGPATAGSTAWDVDGAGADNFFLANSSTLFGKFQAPNSNSVIATPNGLGNLNTGVAVSGAKNWVDATRFSLTYAGGTGGLLNPTFTLNTPGQFGFRFQEGASTYYGWASLLIDGGGFGQGFKITEAYYQSTPGTAINTGAVPVPEPTGIALLALGSAGVFAWRARRNKAT